MTYGRVVVGAVLATLWTLTAGAGDAAAGKPKLANARRVFDGAQPDYKTPTQYQMTALGSAPKI